ncbi:unnamed protein product [Acanthosepion pharaonis]|uniref:Uncharacterized protein n=1 Tax=Acanthosepion pharaonis TaxID=158019 RepID=A0A812DW95_ACAPH|nr:unnamed protein product [Sepia pharaonis]
MGLIYSLSTEVSPHRVHQPLKRYGLNIFIADRSIPIRCLNIFVADRSIPSPGSSTKRYGLNIFVADRSIPSPGSSTKRYGLNIFIADRIPHRVHQPRDMGLIYSLPTPSPGSYRCRHRSSTTDNNIFRFPSPGSSTKRYGLNIFVADRSIPHRVHQPRDMGLIYSLPTKYPSPGSSTKRYGLNVFVADRSIPHRVHQPRDMGLIYSLPTEVSPHRVHQPRDMGLIYSLSTEVSPHRVHQPKIWA